MIAPKIRKPGIRKEVRTLVERDSGYGLADPARDESDEFCLLVLVFHVYDFKFGNRILDILILITVIRQ